MSIMNRGGIIGLGILPLRKHFMRRGKKEHSGEEVGEDVLKRLEGDVHRSLSSFDAALDESECSVCRELLVRIRDMPLEKQAEAIPELRRFIRLAEDKGSNLEEELKNMPALMEVMK